MKKNLILLSIAILACFSCSKDDDSQTWEVEVDCNSPIIKNSIHNIEFVFYLLNEDGIPSTKFKEGENFSFYFAATNNTNEDLNFDPNVIYSNPNMCAVYNVDGTHIGSPYQSTFSLEYIGAGGYLFTQGESSVFTVPWIDERDEWRWYFATFKSSHQNSLSKGTYYTEFEHLFKFKRSVDESTLKIGPLKFKINFKIE